MGNKKNSREIGQMLKKRYVLALSIIAFLVILSQGIVQMTIISQQDDSRIVNIAGRQRMLSQRINKTAFGLYVSTEAKDQDRYLKELTASLELWERSHKGLQSGDSELGLPGKNSAEIVGMFNTIEPQHQALVDSAGSIARIAAVPGYDREKLLPDIRVIQANEQTFLKGMDAIVFQYDAESKQKVKLIKYTEGVILLFTLITLTLEAVFIFRPAQKRIEEAVEELEISHDNLEKLFETAPAAMFLIDGQDFSVLKLNHLALEILNVSPEDSLKLDLRAMLELRQGAVKDMMDQLAAGVSIENAEMILNVPGNLSLVVLLSSNLIRYDDRNTILMGLADITRLKEAEEVLKRYATIDEMTGLLNKRSGMLVMANAFERVHGGSGELSLCFVDLDGLKAVNDTYGHEEGDFYLKTIARVIRNNVSSRDTVFRYGGDEIVLILAECDRVQAEAVLVRIQGGLYTAARESGKPYRMHISHGVAVYSEELPQTPEALLARADQIMYENKRIYKQSLE